jgi:hypothetical protein
MSYQIGSTLGLAIMIGLTSVWSEALHIGVGQIKALNVVFIWHS